ncbi:Pycsar system effector family protein [Kribbella sp. CA-245084]|uniref:Pycsar system effector family protein n=1 Tax=Kribbella sp. CA-245084 TaxID=3239940 RepID=UPI003D92FD29
MATSGQLDGFTAAPESIASLWQVLQTVNDWIKFADAKAGAVLAGDGVLIAVVAQSSDDVTALLLPALVVAVLSGLLALWAVVPRLGLVYPASPFYFNHVASQCEDAKAYREWILPTLRDPAALEQTLSDQIWAMSRVARVKYRWVRFATWLLGLASCCIIIATLVELLR